MPEQSVVAKAVPIGLARTTFCRTCKILILLNCIFLLKAFDPSQPFVAFAIIFCGFWLPALGHLAAEHGETHALRCYAITQCVMSLFVVTSALSVVSFFYTFKSMCKDCHVQFDQGQEQCIWQNTTLRIDLKDCLSLPSGDTVYGACGCLGVLSLVALLTVHQTQSILESHQAKVIVIDRVPPYIEV